MNTYLVFLLFVAIVVFANLIMFAAARSWRGMNIGAFRTTKSEIRKPFKAEEEQLDELRQLVSEYKKGERFSSEEE